MLLLRVDLDRLLGEVRADDVMVGDDDVDPPLAGVGDRVVRRGPAVDRQDEAGARVRRPDRPEPLWKP